ELLRSGEIADVLTARRGDTQAGEKRHDGYHRRHGSKPEIHPPYTQYIRSFVLAQCPWITCPSHSYFLIPIVGTDECLTFTHASANLLDLVLRRCSKALSKHAYSTSYARISDWSLFFSSLKITSPLPIPLHILGFSFM